MCKKDRHITEVEQITTNFQDLILGTMYSNPPSDVRRLIKEIMPQNLDIDISLSTLFHLN